MKCYCNASFWKGTKGDKSYICKGLSAMVLFHADAEPGAKGPPEALSTPATETDGLHVPTRVFPRGRGPGEVDHRADADGNL